MKSGRLIICGGEYLYLKITQRIKEEKLAPDLSFFFKKASNRKEIKAYFLF